MAEFFVTRQSFRIHGSQPEHHDRYTRLSIKAEVLGTHAEIGKFDFVVAQNASEDR